MGRNMTKTRTFVVDIEKVLPSLRGPNGDVATAYEEQLRRRKQQRPGDMTFGAGGNCGCYLFVDITDPFIHLDTFLSDLRGKRGISVRRKACHLFSDLISGPVASHPAPIACWRNVSLFSR